MKIKFYLCFPLTFSVFVDMILSASYEVYILNIAFVNSLMKPRSWDAIYVDGLLFDFSIRFQNFFKCPYKILGFIFLILKYKNYKIRRCCFARAP